MIEENGQIIKYKSLQLSLENREFLSDDNNPYGYSKESGFLPSLENLDFSKRGINSLEKIYFKLEWNLYISYDKYKILTEIIDTYNKELYLQTEKSFSIYDNNFNEDLENILLVDNRIKDIYTSNFETYKILITSLSKLEEVFFLEKKVIINITGETLWLQ